jgi:hypothetical protein
MVSSEPVTCPRIFGPDDVSGRQECPHPPSRNQPDRAAIGFQTTRRFKGVRHSGISLAAVKEVYPDLSASSRGVLPGAHMPVNRHPRMIPHIATKSNWQRADRRPNNAPIHRLIPRGDTRARNNAKRRPISSRRKSGDRSLHMPMLRCTGNVLPECQVVDSWREKSSGRSGYDEGLRISCPTYLELMIAALRHPRPHFALLMRFDRSRVQF